MISDKLSLFEATLSLIFLHFWEYTSSSSDGRSDLLMVFFVSIPGYRAFFNPVPKYNTKRDEENLTTQSAQSDP